jgi:hypothetical protein
VTFCVSEGCHVANDILSSIYARILLQNIEIVPVQLAATWSQLEMLASS